MALINDTPRAASESARKRSLFLPARNTPSWQRALYGPILNAQMGQSKSAPTAESLNPSLDLNALTPKLQDIFLEDLTPPKPDAQQLFQQAMNMRAQQGREAVELRKRQQLEQGVGGNYGDGYYYPADTSAVAQSIRSSVPASQLAGFRRPDAGSVNSTKVVPGIGHITDVQLEDSGANGNRGYVMTGRYGTGSNVQRDKPDPNRTIEGIPAAEWFKRAANRQGADNKYARAETTGRTDQYGAPQMQGVAIPSGSDAGTERIMEAMKSGRYNPAKGGWQIEKRETGGPVEKGKPYLVGEKGPEVVVPKGNGTVIPNNRLLPRHHEFKGLGQAFFSHGLPSPGYIPPDAYSGQVIAPTTQLKAENGNPSQEDVILAVNKIFGTAPARAVPARAGIPFLLQAEPGIKPVIPSAEANTAALKIIQDARVPQELDQATQVQMLTEHMKKIGLIR